MIKTENFDKVEITSQKELRSQLSSSLHELSLNSDLCEVVSGGSIEEFSYEQRWKLPNGEEGGKTNHIRYQLLNTEVTL